MLSLPFSSDRLGMLKVFNCHTHTVFGGCNENVGLAHSELLHGTDNAVVVDTAVVIATRWGWSFYHWIIEELPRLAYVAHMLAEDPNLQVIAHDFPENRLMFELLGVSADRIVAVHRNQMFFVRRLYVPPVAHCGRPALTASRHYRESLRRGLEKRGIIKNGSAMESGKGDGEEGEDGGESMLPGHVVVIQRWGGRRTANQAQLLDALRGSFPRLSFVQYGPEPASLETTGRVFAQARGIIAVHGAGISNVVFSQSGAFLIEIHPRGSNQQTHPNICHQGTAEIFGVRHTLLWVREGSFNADVVVPIPEVVAAVCRFEGGPLATCTEEMLREV